MEQKKDIFYDTLANPEMTLPDLAEVWDYGRNADIQSRDFYKNNKKVQDFFTKNGEFDENAFESAYTTALQALNTVSRQSYNKEVLDNVMFDVDNIWVDPSKRKVEAKPIIIINPNPNRQTTGIYRLGRTTAPTRSIDEIAQTQKILLNPVEVANGAKAEWGDSPNDGWLKDFFKTRVLATWDEDGTHVDPLTGVEMEHKAGEYKLNENGTYYYEDLEGRSVYGKQVLNKLNTITTDGSRWNQFDFFDSDNLEQQSVGKTLAKNLALVGPMFLPVVGPAIAGISVLSQVAGLGTKGAKMLAGLFDIETPGLNNMEGFLKSTNSSYAKTVEAQQNPWCIENIIGMFGDVAGQLKEQRAIFEYAPAIFMGKYGVIAKGEETLRAEKKAEFLKEINTNQKMHEFWRQNLNKYGVENFKDRFINPIEGIAEMVADKGTRAYFKEYNKLGEQIARAYMTAITVQDTYEEAKLAGATDLESVLVTMGYAAAENALLKSDIGRWIFPELKQESVRNRMIAKKLTELPADVKAVGSNLEAATEKEKMNWMKRLIKIGKDVASRDYSASKGTVGMMVANGLAEGFEEVSEEALADFSKGCFNLVQKLQGDDTRMDDLFTNFNLADDFNRYALNFVGGLGGGALNSIKTNYNMLKDYSKMSKEDAQKAIIWMDANDELGDFWESLEKIPLGNKKLSFNVDPTTGLYAKGTKENNQDLAIKTALRNQMKFIHDTVNAEGAKLSDDSVIKKIINIRPDLDAKYGITKSLRYSAWANSATAGWYLKQWNDNLNDLVQAHKEIFDIQQAKSSDSAELSEEQQKQLEVAKHKLAKAQERKDALLKGENALEFLKPVLFETNFGISSTFMAANAIQFAELMTGRKYTDMDKEEQEEWDKKWAAYNSSGSKAEQIATMSEAYWDLIARSGNALKQTEEFYNTHTDTQKSKLLAELKFSEQSLQALLLASQQTMSPEGEEIDPLNTMQGLLINQNQGDIIGQAQFSDNEKTIIPNIKAIFDNLAQIHDSYLSQANDEGILDEDVAYKMRLDLAEYLQKTVYRSLNNLSDEIINLGWAHPEVKNNAIQALKNANKNITEYIASSYLSEEDEFFDRVGSLREVRTNFKQKIEAIENLPNSPLIQMMETITANTDQDHSVVDVIKSVLEKTEATKENLADFNVDNQEELDNAIKALELYRAVLCGTRNDDQDITNLSGNTKLLNTLLPAEEQLYEMSKDTADNVLIDINLAIDRLQSAKVIHDLNAGNKLAATTKDALNLHFINYAKAKQFISILDDDDSERSKWAGQSGEAIAKLKEAFDSLKTTRENSGNGSLKNSDRKFSLSVQDKEAINTESVILGDAIHAFFQDNIHNLEGNNSDELLAGLLKRFNVTVNGKNEKRSLTHTSDTVNDASFITWLGTHAVLSKSQFLNLKKQSTSLAGENPIVSTALQDEAQMMLVASFANRDLFAKFGRARNKMIENWWNSLNDSEKATEGAKLGLSTRSEATDSPMHYLKPNAIRNTDIYQQYLNINFVEGVAGSGKTTAALGDSLNMASKIKPDIKRIIFAHGTKKNADDAVTNLRIDDDLKSKIQTYSRKDLLSQVIANDWQDSTSADGKTAIYVDEQDGGNVRWAKSKDGKLHSTYKTKKLASVEDKPDILIIDEWATYTQADADLIQRWAWENGITVWTFGDLTQLQPKATYYKDKNEQKAGESDPNKGISLAMDRFVQATSYKIGTSMRTDNMQKSNNLGQIEANEITESSDPIKLQWVESEDGLFGDKVYGYTSEADLNQYASLIKGDLNKIIPLLKPNEKIGYIYHSTDSPVYKMISDEFSDKVEMFSEAAAQGREARFYIVEPEPPKPQTTNGSDYSSSSIDHYRKSVYTGISRSSQFSILVAPTPASGMPGFNLVENIKTPDKELIKDAYTTQGLVTYGKQKLSLIDKVLANKNPEELVVEFVPGKFVSTTESPEISAESAEELKENATETTAESGTEGESDESEEEVSFEIPTEAAKTRKKYQPVGQHIWKSSGSYYVGKIVENDHKYTFTGKGGKKVTKYQYKVKKPDGSYIYIDTYGAGKKYKFTTTKSNPFSTFKKGTIFKVIGSTEKFEVLERIVKKDGTNVKYKLKNVDTGDVIEGKDEGQIIRKLREKKWGIVKAKAKKTTTTSTTAPKPTSKPAPEDTTELTPSETMDMHLDFEAPNPKPAGTSSLDDTFEHPGNIHYDASTNTITDIDIHGETFNTFYSGCTFDSEGKIIETSKKAINSGNGLYHINPTKFNNQETVIKGLGELRNICMFTKEIADVSSKFSEVLGIPGINVEFALINKSLTPSYGSYEVYNMDKGQKRINLDRDDYDDNVETHHFISAVAYKDGQAVLEIPILIPQSPLSILAQLEQIGDPVGNTWKTIISNKPDKIYEALAEAQGAIIQTVLGKSYTHDYKSNYHKALQDLKSATKSNPAYSSYIKLFNLIQFWFFTGNGYKSMGKHWSIAKNCINLGNKYVANRKVEAIPRRGIDKVEYTASFKSFDEAKKEGRFYSRIMTVTEDFTQYGLPSGKLFVLSTNDTTRAWTEKTLMDQYLKQQNNASEPKIVRLEYVTPPEISISDYAFKMYSHLKSKKDPTFLENTYWGLALDPTKVAQAIIYAYNDATNGFKLSKTRTLIDSAFAKVNSYMGAEYLTLDKLNDAVKQVIGLDTDTTGMRKGRLSQPYTGSTTNETLGQYINNAIVSIFFKGETKVDVGGAITITSKAIYDKEFVEDLQQGCLRVSGLTGIRGKTKLPKQSDTTKTITSSVGPSTVKTVIIETHSSSSWIHPSGESYRMYSKVDDPKFSFMDDFDNFIEQCNEDAEFNGVWKYQTKKDELKFLGKEVVQEESAKLEEFIKSQTTNWTNQIQKAFNNKKEAQNFVKAVINSLDVSRLNPDTIEQTIESAIISEFIKIPGKLYFELDNSKHFIQLKDTAKDVCPFPTEFLNKFHQTSIVRPTIIGSDISFIDANGQTIDGSLNIDNTKGTYTLTLNETQYKSLWSNASGTVELNTDVFNEDNTQNDAKIDVFRQIYNWNLAHSNELANSPMAGIIQSINNLFEKPKESDDYQKAFNSLLNTSMAGIIIDSIKTLQLQMTQEDPVLKCGLKFIRNL